MSTRTYLLSELAQEHLRTIKHYTVNNYSIAQWKNYKNVLLSGLKMVAENPDIGQSSNHIYPNSFYFHIGKHTAYYTKEKNFILIAAILGQSQLPQKHLNKP